MRGERVWEIVERREKVRHGAISVLPMSLASLACHVYASVAACEAAAVFAESTHILDDAISGFSSPSARLRRSSIRWWRRLIRSRDDQAHVQRVATANPPYSHAAGASAVVDRGERPLAPTNPERPAGA